MKKGVIEIRSILAGLQKDLADSEALFKEIYNSSIISVPPSAVAAAPDPLRLQRQQKLMYMTVALICAHWEGATSKIKNVSRVGTTAHNGIYNGARRGNYYPWYRKDLQIMGNVRACILHHGGKLASYKRYIKRKYRTDVRKRRSRTIPQRYHGGGKQDLTITLKPDDIADFFRSANEAIPKMLQDVGRLFP